MFSQTVTSSSSPLFFFFSSVADVAIRFDCQHLFCVCVCIDLSVAISESFSPGNWMKELPPPSLQWLNLYGKEEGKKLIDVYAYSILKNQYYMYIINTHSLSS